MKTIVIHLDEAGNLAFCKSGTSFFVLTTTARIAPIAQFNDLHLLRERFIKDGVAVDYFHASEDRQVVRNAVFEIIRSGLRTIRIDSLIVEKCKTGPALQTEEQFYPRMIWYLLSWVIAETRFVDAKKVLLITDSIPIQRKRAAIEKAIKERLSPLRGLGI